MTGLPPPGAYIGREDGAVGNPGDRFIRLALVNDSNTVSNALEKLVKVL